MEKHTVYILKCSDDSYYVGYTERNLEVRIAEHQSGENRNAFTYKKRPVKLMWFE